MTVAMPRKLHSFDRCYRILCFAFAVLISFCPPLHAEDFFSLLLPAVDVDELNIAEVMTVAPEMPVADSTEDFSAFDFYIGGNYYDIIYGYFDAESFRADKPEDFIAAMPAVVDKNAFLPLFNGKIPREKSIKGVGKIQIDINHFRIDLEIDREQAILLKVGGVDVLESTDKNLSVRNKMFLAGSTETQNLDFTQNFSFSHDTVINKENLSFLSAGTLTKGEGYKITNAAVRQDFSAFGQPLTGSGGMLQTSGPRFAKSLDFFGLKVVSNQILFFKDPLSQASNIEIFLPQRSKVEIFRNSESSGMAIFSRQLDFGTVQIDTRSFPMGSYDIEIVVTDNFGVKSRERRPFTKAARLTPHGSPQVDIEGGVVRDDMKGTDILIMLVSGKKRITDNIDGSLTTYMTGDDQIYEAGLNFEGKLPLLGYMGMITASLTGAIDSSASLAGLETSVSWIGDNFSTTLIANKTFDRSRLVSLGSLALTDRQSIGFNMSMPLLLLSDTARLDFNSELSRTREAGKKYRYGPTLTMKLPNLGAYSTKMKVEHVISDDDKRILASLVLRNEAGLWTKTGEVFGHRQNVGTSATTRAGLVFNGEHFGDDDWRRNIRADASLMVDPMVTTENGKSAVGFFDSNATYRGKGAKIQAYLNQNVRELTGQLGGEVASALLWSRASGLTASGKEMSAEEAFVMLRLKGTEKNKIGIQVNGTTRGYGYPGDTMMIPVPVYQQSKISAFDDGGKISVRIKEKAQEIVSYPGNLIYREFTISRSYFMVGILIDGEGKPLVDERFEIDGVVYYTDEEGNFSLELSLEENQKLEIATATRKCNLIALHLSKDEIFYDADQVVCK